MKKNLLLLLTFLSFLQLKAQYIALNDSCLTAQLKKLSPSCFNASNELDTTCTALNSITSLNLFDCNDQFFNKPINFNNDIFLKYYKNLTSLGYTANVPFSSIEEFRDLSPYPVYYSPYNLTLDIQNAPASLKTFSFDIILPPGLENTYEESGLSLYGGSISNIYVKNVPPSVTNLNLKTNNIKINPNLTNITDLNLTCAFVDYYGQVPLYIGVTDVYIDSLNNGLKNLTIGGVNNSRYPFPSSLKNFELSIYNYGFTPSIINLENILPDGLETLFISPSGEEVFNLPKLPSQLKNFFTYTPNNSLALTCLPLINDSLRTWPFDCLPNENEFIKATVGLPLCTDLSKLCQLPPLFPKGKVYLDANKNGKYDNGEIFISGAAIQNSVIQNTYFSQSDSGKYAVNFVNGISNIISATYNNPLVNAIVPSQYSFTPNESIENPDTLNFGIQFKEDLNDIATSVTSATPARPGFGTTAVAIVEEHSGKSFNNITLKFVKPSDWTFNNAVPAISSISGDTLIWNNISVSPLEKKPFEIRLTLPATADIIGDPFQYSSFVSFSTTDSDITNNNAAYNGIIRGSYDPNDKLVNTPTLLPDDLDEELTYTIRFQNTGNDTAFTVVIKDSLLSSLNPESIRFLSASHSYTTELDKNNVLIFTFENILLPDSNVNEPASHGYIMFAITPNDELVLGDSILNKAAIYFDFNEPVITNTTKTEVKIINNIYSRSNSTLIVYPNPARDFIRVEGKNIQNSVLTLTDVTGKIIFSQKLQNNWVSIPVHQFQKGLYIVTIRNEQELSVAKVLIQ